jgi:hypothetical protein
VRNLAAPRGESRPPIRADGNRVQKFGARLACFRRMRGVSGCSEFRGRLCNVHVARSPHARAVTRRPAHSPKEHPHGGRRGRSYRSCRTSRVGHRARFSGPS